jgi:senataxin
MGRGLNDETEQAKKVRMNAVSDAKDRIRKVLYSLRILAFDGPDAHQLKERLKGRVGVDLGQCEVCVRTYHKSRADLEQSLLAEYPEETVQRFLALFDDFNIERIKEGLRSAEEQLERAAPKSRGVSSILPANLYAFFEAFSCDPFLRQEHLLLQHLDRPLMLIQTKRPLKLNGIFLPALFRFLFSTNEERYKWAIVNWNRVEAPFTRMDFEWTARGALASAMGRMQLPNVDQSYLDRFWEAMHLVLQRLDNNLIIHSLREMDYDVCRLALEHLRFEPGFAKLLNCITLLLKQSPRDFWFAMDEMSAPPANVAEQIFNNPGLHAQMRNGATETAMDQYFSWINPFLASVKTGNITPGCRAIVNQTLNIFQSDTFARSSRSLCELVGLRCLRGTLRRMIADKDQATQERPTSINSANVSEILKLIDEHQSTILPITTAVDPDNEALNLALDVIRNALELDIVMLEVERDMIKSGLNIMHSNTPSCSQLWHTVAHAIRPHNTKLPITALVAAKRLVGLEPFCTSAPHGLNQDQKYYNKKLKSFSDPISGILDELNDCTVAELNAIFENADQAGSVLVALFTAEDDTVYLSASEILRSVSSKDERQEFLTHLLESFCDNTLMAFADAMHRIAQRKAYAPSPIAVKICKDVVEVLCDPQDGLFRTRDQQNLMKKAAERPSLWLFWESTWRMLRGIFDLMENWSEQKYASKDILKEVCRDTIELADTLLDNFNIVGEVMHKVSLQKEPQQPAIINSKLLKGPIDAFGKMARWLRLRDEFLAEKFVDLTCKLLGELKQADAQIPNADTAFLRQVITGKTKTILSPQGKSRIQVSLEDFLGSPLELPKSTETKPITGHGQKRIGEFFKLGQLDKSVTSSTEPKQDEDNELKKIIAASTEGANAYRAKIAAQKKLQTVTSKALPQAPKKPELNKESFLLQRKRDMEEEKKRKAAIAEERRRREEAKKASVMVSSESEDDEDELDAELFGLNKNDKQSKSSKPMVVSNKISISTEQLPVKKQRIQRSVKDMRARLAPDLRKLHTDILTWEFFHDGHYPPNCASYMYETVPGTFRDPEEYSRVFYNLLLLEAWQYFVKTREELTSKPYQIKVTNRSTVDAFQHITSTVKIQESKDIGVMEGDIILLSKASNPLDSQDEAHCLARVGNIKRKKGNAEISYAVTPSGPGASLVRNIGPGSEIYGLKVDSITTLEREYGALKGFPYYDLCDEINRAKPSPMLKYSDKQLEHILNNYQVNKAQAKAIKSSIDNDGFTLIQG